MKIRKKNTKSDREKTLWLKRLGFQIKFFRQENGLSQADLAYSIDMDAQNISRIERGLINPSAYSIKLICQVLQISIAEFYLSFDK